MIILLGVQVAAAQQLSEETSEAIEALKQRDRLQAMLREAHTSLTALQVSGSGNPADCPI